MSSDVRNKRIIGSIDISKGSGLEIGPLMTPIVLKSHADIYYADHMSAEDLRRKYKTEPVDPEKIVPVDFVLGDKKISEAVGNKKFNYVIASHVIEHLPDMISWLQDIGSILKDGGTLSLVIPDKRYTFDITRQNSTPADVIGAYIEKRTRADSATMFDFANNYIKDVLPVEVWSNPFADTKTMKHRYDLNESYEMCKQNLDPATYVDSHCFVFTPYSFVEILRALIDLDLLNYKVLSFEETHEGEMEFYIGLQKTTDEIDAKRRSLPQLAAPISGTNLEQEVESLRHEVARLKNSRSWKVTRPMRKLIRTAKRVKRKA